MPTVVFVDSAGHSLTAAAPGGGGLVGLCDELDSPVPFHCRRGTCGTCRVAVLQGAEQLQPPDAHELRTLRMLGLSHEHHRLACQAQMQPGLGSLQIRPLGRKARKARRVRAAIEQKAGVLRVRTPAAGACEVLVSGASALNSGDVILLAFHPPGTPRPREVVARVVEIESTEALADGATCLMAIVELLEHDDHLASLFPPDGIAVLGATAAE